MTNSDDQAPQPVASGLSAIKPGLIWRLPFVIFAANGFLSTVQDAVQWQEALGRWFEAWRSFSQPVAQFLFGWMFSLTPWTMPDFLGDYLVFSLIVSGALMRSVKFSGAWGEPDFKNKPIVETFVALFFLAFLALTWPLFLIRLLGSELMHGRSADRVRAPFLDAANLRVFLEVFAVAGLVIVINYLWIAH